MKKVILASLLAILLLLLCACGGSSEPEIFGTPDPNFTPPAADIYGTWYAAPENGELAITIHNDGTCVVGDQAHYWSVWKETEDEVQLNYSGVYISISGLSRSMPVLYSQEYGTMVRTPLLWQYRGIWETDDGRQAYLDEYDLQFIDGGYAQLQMTQEGEVLIFTAIAMDGTEQTVRMQVVDGYPIAEVTDGSGKVITYYRPENRPPVNEMELLYQEAIEKLNTALAGGSIHYDDTNKVTHGCNAYAHIYQLFEQLGDYKDAKQYLANFKVIEDVFVKTAEPGETFNTGLLYVYGEYDNQGRRLTGEVTDDTAMGFDITGGFYQLTYGENGLVSQILTHNGDDRVPVAIGIPTYDEKGNMISLDVTFTPDAERTYNYTSQFTYDENGRRLTAVIPEVLDNAVSYYWYYYDAEGKLLQITQDFIRNGKETPSIRRIREYIYDGNGYLVGVRYHHTQPGAGMLSWIYIETVYVNDAEGKCLTSFRTAGEIASLRDESGNLGVAGESSAPGVYTEAGELYYQMHKKIFGMYPDPTAHDWLICTTGMELNVVDMLTFEPVGEPTESQYLYTDVYIYCPEN